MRREAAIEVLPRWFELSLCVAMSNAEKKEPAGEGGLSEGQRGVSGLGQVT